MNPAGDSMNSIAESLGLSEVLRYLESLSDGIKGDCVGINRLLPSSCCEDI